MAKVTKKADKLTKLLENNKKPETTLVTIRLEKELLDAVDALAKRHKVTRTDIIKVSIKEGLKQ